MKILSLNLCGKNNIQDIKENVQADIYAFQESHLHLTGRTRINTVNVINDKCEKEKMDKFEEIWEESFPWIEFPENYFAENKINIENISFTLINVHLAGFRSELRQLLMFVLLKRLKSEDLESENVILVGDFNAEQVQETSTKLQRRGSSYLDKIIKIGYKELKYENENMGQMIDTFRDKQMIGHRFDHAYVRYREKNPLFTIDVEYFPEGDKKWFSDHRGIILKLREPSERGD